MRKSIQWQKLSLKIKNFLQSTQCKEFLIFSFFLFISSTFWLLRALNETYETELKIPLRIKNLPENSVITSDIPSVLKIGVKDKGTVLMNYLISKSFIPVVIDFEEIQNKGNHIRLLSSEFQKKILGQLTVSTSIEHINPDTLEIIYTQRKGKKIPIRFNGKITPKRQYYIVDETFTPDSVMVYAPDYILDTITTAYTVPLILNEVSDTVKQTVELKPYKGIKLTPCQSTLTVYTDILTEKTVTVPIKGIDFPMNKSLKTFPSKVNVTFLVGSHNFKGITAEDFNIEISYDELIRQSSDKYQPKLTTYPIGISHIRISPETIDYLIEHNSHNVNE